MKKIIHQPYLALAVAAIISLSGCGGEGGGNDSEPQTHTVSAIAGTGGTISPVSQTVEHGATTILTLQPDDGYAIENASGCGGELNEETFTTGEIIESCSVTASFVKLNYTVNSISGTGGYLSPSIDSVLYGESPRFNVTAEIGYSIESIIGCNGSLDGSTYITAPVISDCIVSASFIEGPQSSLYRIDTSADQPFGGSVSGGGGYSEGSLVTVTAVAEPGYRFVSWNETGSLVSDNPNYSFSVTADHQLVAQFVPKTFNVNVTVSSGGLVEPSERVVTFGEPATFTLIPDDGYSIQRVTGCNGIREGNTYTVDRMTEDCEVTVIFSRYPVLKFNEGLLNQRSLG